jgi:hypothetical protein
MGDNRISMKYSVFDRDGKPLRALATVKVKEASVSTFDRPSIFRSDRHDAIGGYTSAAKKGLPR